MKMESPLNGSKDSLYKSATDSENENDVLPTPLPRTKPDLPSSISPPSSNLSDEGKMVIHKFRKPDYLCGSVCSEDYDEDVDINQTPSSTSVKSTFHVLASKLNLSRNFNFGDSIHSYPQNILENRVTAEIIGYDTIYNDRKFTAYKIRVKQNEKWSTTNILSWILYRRYNDFVTLNGKIKDDISLKDIKVPGKTWFEDQFDSVFIGQRIALLTSYMNRLLEHVDDNISIRDFFCIDTPPLINSHTVGGGGSSSHLIFDSHHEVVQELREQLRQNEQLNEMTESLKDILQQKDSEIDYLRTELETLKKQKDTLMKAFSSSIDDLSGKHLSLSTCRINYTPTPNIEDTQSVDSVETPP